MVTLYCLECEETFEIQDEWNMLGDLIQCSNCLTEFTLDYDESYHEGEEYNYFFLTRV